MALHESHLKPDLEFMRSVQTKPESDLYRLAQLSRPGQCAKTRKQNSVANVAHLVRSIPNKLDECVRNREHVNHTILNTTVIQLPVFVFFFRHSDILFHFYDKCFLLCTDFVLRKHTISFFYKKKHKLYVYYYILWDKYLKAGKIFVYSKCSNRFYFCFISL